MIVLNQATQIIARMQIYLEIAKFVIVVTDGMEIIVFLI